MVITTAWEMYLCCGFYKGSQSHRPLFKHRRIIGLTPSPTIFKRKSLLSVASRINWPKTTLGLATALRPKGQGLSSNFTRVIDASRNFAIIAGQSLQG